MKLILNDSTEIAIKSVVETSSGLQIVTKATSMDAVESAIKDDNNLKSLKTTTDAGYANGRYYDQVLQCIKKEDGAVTILTERKKAEATVDVSEKLEILQAKITEVIEENGTLRSDLDYIAISTETEL